ncbi:MAG: RNA polymerase sigma factor [Planctomycetota bacterium]|nr:MAG: RNA polymerase sigma factor [Planctomycetota bacterium]REK21165.1 MAG: RNA polymerase sigma factor [Planctomycetota bacterium]REK29573.1 MAG: RNA polymerase sigma factor [Planctomycetota bacterium]
MADEGPLTATEDWDRLIAGLQQGDALVLRDFYANYGPHLQRIADGRVSPVMKRRFDSEDVIQSTFRTFFRRAQGGYFQFEDNQRLWNLLCAITLTKVREKVRFHRRKSRGVDREVSQDGDSDSGERAAFDGGSAEQAPNPADAVEFADTFENLIAGLDADQRRLVDLKLQDVTNDEAAEELGVSERTVRRMLSRLQEQFEQQLQPDASA